MGWDGCMGIAPSAESTWVMRQPPMPRYHALHTGARRAARKRSPATAPEALAPMDERDARISAALAALAASRGAPESA